MTAPTELGLNCDEVEDSLGAYALGALDADEVVAVEEHVANCPACRQRLLTDLQTVEALALTVAPVEPSPKVRDRLLQAAATTPTLTIRQPISIDDAREARRGRRLTRWILPAVSVAAVLLLIGVGVLGTMLQRAIDERDESRSVAQLLSTYVSSGGQVVTLEAQPVSIYENYQGQGSLLTAPGKEPVVVVAECPESGDMLTYWVWFSREGERTPAGKLTVGDDGSGWLTVDSDLLLNQFDTIGITVVLENDGREDVLVAPLSEGVSEG
jgi:hypothetical protein